MSNKKNNKQKKQKTIVVKQTADGKDEVIITKAPSKTVLGKIVIAVTCFRNDYRCNRKFSYCACSSFQITIN